MKVCPNCGFKDSPLWKPLFWKIYWEYIDELDFIPTFWNPSDTKLMLTMVELASQPHKKHRNEEGNFTYDFEDRYYYYKLAGRRRKMIHRFPKGFESMANRKLFEKTPSEVEK